MTRTWSSWASSRARTRTSLKQKEEQVLHAQLELGQVEREMDRRVADKEGELNNTSSLEAEQKVKG